MSSDEMIYETPPPWRFNAQTIDNIRKDVELNLSQLPLVIAQNNDKKLVSARIKQRMGG